ncbi:chromatin remodelling complex Rsc7/Swp82 subunit-domain-containing protein [Spinellus fusiger]|nr:chromatin remodelling complex Rsc7/Swp82 subunit-domain-containing protein [Spinellus fusiger]
MDPAKVLGYRDSYLFFHKNPRLKRVRITEEEKAWLVQQNMLVSWFKNRDVAVVTARSVFKYFGSKIIKKGKQHKDDYFENEKDKESAAEEAFVPRKPLIADTVISDLYSTQTPVDQATWMHHTALAVRGFNAQLYARRADKPTFYDIHTNTFQVPCASQPTYCHFQPTTGETDIEFECFSVNQPRLQGCGIDLLEGSYDLQSALDTLSPEQSKAAMHRLKCLQPALEETSDAYPIALAEGQFQGSFPIDLARFSQPTPTFISPSTTNDTVQSIMAQQYYLNQVYQAVNSNLVFTEQEKQANAHSSHRNFHPTTNHPTTNITSTPPTTTLSTARPSSSASSPGVSICGHMTPKGQACKRVVMFAGEKCQMHVSSAAHHTATTTSYAENKCADCHYLSAPIAVMPKDKNTFCDVFAMVKCVKCTQRYHPVCVHLNTPRQVATVESYPWTCPACKVCCVCKQLGDKSKLMVCNGCDRGWHTLCCQPALSSAPPGPWLCPLCSDCHSCDGRESKKDTCYHHAIAPPSERYKYPVYLATFCSSCYDNFVQDRMCPVCLKTYSEDDSEEDDNEMVACDSCDYWIHTSCDETLTPEHYQKLCDNEDTKYTCPLCSDSVRPLVRTGTAVMALKGLSAPSGYSVGLLGGKVKTRGVVTYKKAKVGVPEINGTGIAEMPQL